METILGEWEAFAATLLPAAAGVPSLALRDDAKQILEAVAKDLSTPRTKEAQAEKSKGRVPVEVDQIERFVKSARHGLSHRALKLLKARPALCINDHNLTVENGGSQL
jgi:hypothetical protein